MRHSTDNFLVALEFLAPRKPWAVPFPIPRGYGDRPDIFTRMSWNALVLLSSPTIPAPVRQDLEVRILAGESVGGPEIVRARGALKPGRPKRADQPAMRMAA